MVCERPGVLAEHAEVGSVAQAGEVIIRLRDETLLAQRATAQKESENDIEVRFAQKSAELRALKHERALAANELHPGAVTEIELRELLLDAQQAALQLEQAEHVHAVTRLRLAEIDSELAALRLLAPKRVFVRAVHKRPGEAVQSGETVAEVVGVDRVRVEGHVDLVSAERLRTGGPALLRMRDGGGDQWFRGVISFVDVKVEPVTQRVRFAADFPNDSGRLREGILATVWTQGDGVVTTAALNQR